MMNEEAMAAWIEENFKSNLDVIEDLSYPQIKQMVQDREYVLIYACKYLVLCIIFCFHIWCLFRSVHPYLVALIITYPRHPRQTLAHKVQVNP